MKKIGKFPIIITTKIGEQTTEIQKNRTIYSLNNKLIMFHCGKYIPVTSNENNEYFALHEPETQPEPVAS